MRRDEAQPATAQLKMAPLSWDRRGKPSSVLSWLGTASEGGLATPALLLPVMLTTSEVEAFYLLPGRCAANLCVTWEAALHQKSHLHW